MRIALLILILSPLLTNAQKYALLHKNHNQPIIYTDSVSVEQVAQGYFPVEKEKIDTFLANLSYINQIVKDGKAGRRSKFESFELRNGQTTITVERIKAAYGDKYNAVAKTTAGEVIAVGSFLQADDTEKKGMKDLKDTIDYITQNQSIFGNYREIKPKIYNVYVIRE
jgi:hypothetical protein